MSRVLICILHTTRPCCCTPGRDRALRCGRRQPTSSLRQYLTLVKAGWAAGLDNETDCTGGATYAQWRYVAGRAPPAHPHTFNLPSEVPLTAATACRSLQLPFGSVWLRIACPLHESRRAPVRTLCQGPLGCERAQRD